ncbi:M16 family metallopeptidase [Solicola gregarius]|uniref:Insulinase family protein n=1 Tax=Solicola gregarius TaxID=2908642 RepID=A0AA46YJM6_9ACTN|nr:pitrilysin family protein [Solicola gregarius]UYM04497.1 insulinase family protein [Solicola gregarius]
MSPIALAPDQAPGTTRTVLRSDDGGLVRRTVLPGGLRVVTEAMPGVRSATIGMWVGVGSRDETPTLAGASHFLEHLLFKGTPSRSAVDISSALEAVGGEMNAYTAREHTCYHARVIDSDLPLAIDVLSDMVTGSRLAADDVEAERGVILEEIAMNDDDPDDVVHNLIVAQSWRGSRLGAPVAGDPATVSSLTRRQIAGYYRRRYRPSSIVVAVAGNVEHRAVVRRVRKAFEAAGVLDDDDAMPALPRRGGREVPFNGGVSVLERATEQANVVLGLAGLRRGDARRHALGVLNAAMGGGMSSRLFQEVREKRALAYSVYSFTNQYADAGMVGVYAGCAPSKVDDVLDVCRAELANIAAHGLTADELARGKGQLRGGLVLGLEDPASRMARIGRADLLHGELASIDGLLASIDGVTLDDVRDVAGDLLATEPALAVVGPFDDPSRFA